MTRRRTPLLLGGVLVTGALLVAGCGVPDRGDPSPIEQVPFGLDATTTTSTTSTTTTTTTVPSNVSISSTTTTTVPAELVALYYVGDRGLEPVIEPVRRPASLNSALTALIRRDGAADHGLRSAVPEGVVIRARDGGDGVATVDLPTGFFDEIDTVDQRLAIGQIALTLLGRPGIGQVRFTQDGNPLAVPTGSGVLAIRGQALSRRDYAGLLVPAPDAGR